LIQRKQPISNDDPAGAGLESVDDGRMWVSPSYRSSLRRAGLGRFDEVMDYRGGRCLRRLADRENWHLRIDGAHRSEGVYLKKHHVRTSWGRLRAWLGLGPGETPGRVEARNAGRLAADGVEVMRLVGYGENLGEDGTAESFLLTEELAGYLPLDFFLLERFPALHRQRDDAREHALLDLIDRVARVARRLHEAGYNHRDLYCCHFFVKQEAGGPADIKLIDLQRVQRRRRFRRRWLVKDLAQLAYSAPRTRIKCTHKMAFIRRYLGVGKLRPRDKRLIREILAKQQLMERHLGIEA
jgi:hypothetical protein